MIEEVNIMEMCRLAMRAIINNETRQIKILNRSI